MSIIVVAGAVANQPGNGGGVWEKMSWVTGLRQLGFEVWFVEQIAPAACVNTQGAVVDVAASINYVWLRSVAEWFGIGERYALVSADDNTCLGASWEKLLEVAEAANLLVNISGHLKLEPLLRRFGRKAYIDKDPGFTQFWHADPATAFRVGGHDWYFTIGENIGARDCPIPRREINWRPIRQPVVLADWPVTTVENRRRFTTVGSWRGAFGPVQFGGQTYGLKVHEFRKFASLPRQFGEGKGDPIFEAALDIHSADAKDRALLLENRWRLVEPRAIASSPAAFRQFVQESAAECSVAQGVYVETNSGWFSDRSLRYLASGKPVLVQDTGFSRNLPVGHGIVPFRTLDEAAAGARRIMSDYEAHCQAARTIAERYFDSNKVLGRFLEEIGGC